MTGGDNGGYGDMEVRGKRVLFRRDIVVLTLRALAKLPLLRTHLLGPEAGRNEGPQRSSRALLVRENRLCYWMICSWMVSSSV